jgi:hypothetical protein
MEPTTLPALDEALKNLPLRVTIHQFGKFARFRSHQELTHLTAGPTLCSLSDPEFASYANASTPDSSPDFP